MFGYMSLFAFITIISIIFYFFSNFRNVDNESSGLHLYNIELQKIFTYFSLWNSIFLFFILWYWFTDYLTQLAIFPAGEIVFGFVISLTIIINVYGLISILFQLVSEQKKLNRNLEFAIIQLKNINFNVKEMNNES